MIISCPGDCGQKSCTKWLVLEKKRSFCEGPLSYRSWCLQLFTSPSRLDPRSITGEKILPPKTSWAEAHGKEKREHICGGKNHWKTELCFVDGINVKQGPLERIILKRNEKYIKLCLIYGIYRLLTSRYKVLFPWSSLSLMYYLSVNVVHSEHNSYGNISVPTAALLHPWNSVIFKFPHC